MAPMEVNGTAYSVARLLGKGKGGYSYLVERDGQRYVLKQLHHEPCDYYAFGDKFAAEMNDYRRLLAVGIRVPKLIDADRAEERILKQYIEGPTVMELLSKGGTADTYLPQVCAMAAAAKRAGLNIDYYPTNFVVSGGLLWYVDYECNDYMEEWSFERWGIGHWMPSDAST